MLRLYNFVEARERLQTVIRKTRLIHSDTFSMETSNDIYIKPENLQRTGSFKIRGAYNKMAKLTYEEKARGVIASSAGNHAQGVALAGQKLGIKSVIVMPKHTPLIKVEATRGYGAEVVLSGEDYDGAYKKALELQEKEGYTFVHPFDDEDVIEGQGTISLFCFFSSFFSNSLSVSKDRYFQSTSIENENLLLLFRVILNSGESVFIKYLSLIFISSAEIHS